MKVHAGHRGMPQAPQLCSKADPDQSRVPGPHRSLEPSLYFLTHMALPSVSQERNELEDVGQWACGRPDVGGGLPPIDSDGEDAVFSEELTLEKLQEPGARPSLGARCCAGSRAAGASGCNERGAKHRTWQNPKALASCRRHCTCCSPKRDGSDGVSDDIRMVALSRTRCCRQGKRNAMRVSSNLRTKQLIGHCEGVDIWLDKVAI